VPRRRSPVRAGRSHRSPTPVPRSQAGVWLAEAERLYQDFVDLTPYRFTPLLRSFDSFAEYERWRHAQTNPWYR
jgi:hypothetical protein